MPTAENQALKVPHTSAKRASGELADPHSLSSDSKRARMTVSEELEPFSLGLNNEKGKKAMPAAVGDLESQGKGSLSLGKRDRLASSEGKEDISQVDFATMLEPKQPASHKVSEGSRFPTRALPLHSSHSMLRLSSTV